MEALSQLFSRRFGVRRKARPVSDLFDGNVSETLGGKESQIFIYVSQFSPRGDRNGCVGEHVQQCKKSVFVSGGYFLSF